MFTASDGTLFDTATVSITIAAVNDTLIVSNSTVTTNEDTDYSGTFSSSDVDNDSLIYAIASNPANGTVTLSGCADFVIGSLPFSHQHSNTTADNHWDVSGSDGADIAYQLTLSDSTTIDVTTCAVFTDYDTKLEIFTADGNCVATTTGNYVDDATCTVSSVNPPSYAASLSDVTLGAGTYYIVVDGYGGNTGNYQVDVTVSTGREGNPGSGQFDLAYELEKLRADGLTDWEINEILTQRPDEPINNNIRSNNSYVYTPNANYNGSDSFTFSASDGVLLDTCLLYTSDAADE